MYRQVDGIAMGSPLGVLFANFFMGTIETTTLTDDRPSIYCRYVDDIFVRVKDHQELQALRQRLINASGLNFTFEESSGGRLPFLDVLVSARDAGFDTAVYVKATNKGLCLNGNSECPQRYLRSTVSAYVRRALSHCSNWSSVHKEMERLTQVLVNNGYNNSVINNVVERALDRWYSNDALPSPPQQEIKLFYRSYMSSAHKTDEKTIKDIIHKNVKPTHTDTHINFTIYYKSAKTSQLLLRNRPAMKLPPLQKDHVIYQHTCNHEDSGPHTYIGMTRTRLTRRLTCHLQSGAIKSHYHTEHNIKLTRQHLDEKTVIIDKERDSRRILLMEALYIAELKPTINSQVDF